MTTAKVCSRRIQQFLTHRLSQGLGLGAAVILGLAATTAIAAETTCSVGKPQFFAPFEGFGNNPHRFRINVLVQFSAPVTGRITAATLNGQPLFKAGDRRLGLDTFNVKQERLGGAKLEKVQKLFVQLYCDWVGDETYRVGITATTKDGVALTGESQPAIAPQGGRVRLDLPAYKTISVKETGGLERKAWPVVASVLFQPGEVQDPAADLLLVRHDRNAADGYAVVPFQVLDSVVPGYAAENGRVEPKDPIAPRLHRVDLCFLADVPANGASHVFLYYGKPGIAKPAAAGAPQLRYDGEGLGVAVDTGPASFSFDPKSGQLLTYTPRLAEVATALGFVQKVPRPCHWNPDVWAPPSSWGHTSDWGSPGLGSPELTTVRGPLVYRSVRTGTIPNSNGVRARVSYTMFAGMPFILESSEMEFTTNTEVNAVRHNELVFSRGIHTHTAWVDERGETTVRRLYDPQEPFHFYGTVMETGPDVPWVALLNDQKKYGIAVVNLSRLDSAPGVAAVPDGDARYYALDYSEWGTAENFDMNFAYICRPLVYRHTIVPKGAVFAEDSAFLAFKVGDGKHQLDSLKDWAAMLRKPLVVDVR